MLLHSQIIGKGKPFIILHGFLGSGDNWKTLGRRFSEKGYQIHLVDLRNHGHSFHSHIFDYKSMAEDVREYCQHYALDDILLLGHSMGGKTAMEYACLYPETVLKLIIADIGPKKYPQHHQDILKALQSLDFSRIKTREMADEFLSTYIQDIGTRLFLLKNLYWKNKGELALRINLPVLLENIEEVGKALPTEFIYNGDTLFLKGSKSGYIEDIDELSIVKHFPKALIKTVSNAGHWLHAENPEEFYDNVMDFL